LLQPHGHTLSGGFIGPAFSPRAAYRIETRAACLPASDVTDPSRHLLAGCLAPNHSGARMFRRSQPRKRLRLAQKRAQWRRRAGSQGMGAAEQARRALGDRRRASPLGRLSARDGHKIRVFLDRKRTEMYPVCTRLDRKVAVSRGLRRDENGRARAKPWRSLLLDDAASNAGPRAASGVGLVVVGHGVNHQRSAAGVK
jgi:hypothetical protein